MGKPIPTLNERIEARLERIYNRLVDPHFWVMIGLSLLLLGTFAALLWLAVRTFDSTFTLHTIVCHVNDDDEMDRKILAIVFTAPFFGISVLGTISEMWHNLEFRRLGRPHRWRAFLSFTTLVLLLGTVLSVALDC